VTFLRSLLTRAISKTDIWGRGDDWDGGVDAGVSVNQSTALRFIAVYACVRLLSDTVAALPADVYRKSNGNRMPVEPGPPWLRLPNPETTWFELIERVMSSLNIDGNAYILITARDRNAFPAEIWTLHPQEVRVTRERGFLEYVWKGQQRFRRYTSSTPDGDVLQIKAFNNGGDTGLSPIAVGRQAIGLGVATEKFGSTFFGRGTAMPGIITLPATEKKKSEEFVDSIRENWQRKQGGPANSHLPGILTGGATWTSMSIPPDHAQFLETRKYQVTDIARLFNVPPHMIQDLERATFSNIEHQAIDFVVHSITPWLVRLEGAFNQLTPRGQYVKWNVNGLLRGDAVSRSQFYASAIQNGWMNREEVRELEDRNPADGLDEFLVPANLTLADLLQTPVAAPSPNGKTPQPVGSDALASGG
jgi:HK97 family phage portal protein